MDDEQRRDLVDSHWASSAAGDWDGEDQIYDENVIIDYPQSGERINGRANIRALRSQHPMKLAFEVRRVLGAGDLWLTEYVISYDGRPVNTVSIMEFQGDRVVHETQYFADPFDPPAWRAQWVERT